MWKKEKKVVMKEEFVLPTAPNLKDIRLSDEDIARYNKEIEEWDEFLGDKTDIMWMFNKFKDLALTFDQSYYIDIINRYIETAVKEWSKKKYKWYETQFMVVYQILFQWYSEIDFDNDMLPNSFTLSWELRDSDKNKDVFLYASRWLFSLLDSELEKINKEEVSVYTMWRRNVIEHIWINFAKTILQVFGDSLMKTIIEWFSNFEIK